MPTQQQVLDAFDALGGTFNQPMALVKQLECEGFDVGSIPTAINAALAAGVLIKTPSGSLRKK